MNNHWLYIPIEVKHREFHSRLILSALAASHGYRVLLGKDRTIRRIAPTLPKGIVFDKSLGPARHGKPQRLRRLGHKMVVHDEEATGFFGSPDRFILTRMENETLAACESWYCISLALQQDAASRFTEHKKRFKVSGLMRTDVWRKEFHGFYLSERDRILKQTGRFILFNSNFGAIIHARGDRFFKKQVRGMKKEYSGIEQAIDKITREALPNLEAFEQLLPRLAEWFPNHKIVIRPHPSESLAYWENRFAGNGQILVRNQGAAAPWILASDMMIHHGCTTGIEAELMGAQHLMYAPFPDEHHETEVMQVFAPIEKSEQGVKDFISKNIGKPVRTRRTREKERFFANLQGKLVTEAIIEDLDKIKIPSGDLPTSLPLLVKARIWLANNKLRSARDKTYSLQKWPGTSTTEIEEGLVIANQGLGLEQRLKANEVYDEVWEISAT